MKIVLTFEAPALRTEWDENKAGQAEEDLLNQHLPGPFSTQPETSDPQHTGLPSVLATAGSVVETITRR